MDDCSPDPAANHLRSVQDNPHLTIIRCTSNGGISAAMNLGLTAATANLIAFLDQDDWWPEEFLQGHVEHVRHGQTIAYDCTIIHKDRGVDSNADSLFASRQSWPPKELTYKNFLLAFHDIPMTKILAATSDIRAVAGYDSRFDGIQDFHLIIKLLANNVRIMFRDEPRGYYFRHAEQVTNMVAQPKIFGPRPREMALQKWMLFFDAVPRELDLPDDVAAECRRAYRRSQGEWVRHRLVSAVRTGNIRLATHDVFRPACKYWPEAFLGAARAVRRRWSEMRRP